MLDVLTGVWEWVSFAWSNLGDIVLLALVGGAYWLGRRHGRRG